MQNDSSIYKVPHLEDFEDTHFIAPEIDNTETTPTTISVFQELNAIAEEIEQCRRRNT